MNLKVICVYLGPRRSPPKESKNALELLQFLISKEFEIDPGCPCDTLIVHNQTSENNQYVEEGERLLAEIDGQHTKRGKIIIATRENIGLSYGAFSYAFASFPNYEHYAFVEDDRVLIQDGWLSQAISQLTDGVGFVAFVGAYNPDNSPGYAHLAHCHCGMGVTRRDILEQITAKHGRLPYHISGQLPDDPYYEVWLSYGPPELYEYQEVLGEIRFTHEIFRLGYRLVDINTAYRNCTCSAT